MALTLIAFLSSPFIYGTCGFLINFCFTGACMSMNSVSSLLCNRGTSSGSSKTSLTWNRTSGRSDTNLSGSDFFHRSIIVQVVSD